MKKETENGYEYTDRLFKEIQKDSKHLLPIEEAIDYIKFYGLEELLDSHGKIRVVGKAAIRSIINDVVKKEGDPV